MHEIEFIASQFAVEFEADCAGAHLAGLRALLLARKEVGRKLINRSLALRLGAQCRRAYPTG